MKRTAAVLVGLLCVLIIPTRSFGQGYAGDRAALELPMLIDKPTAGMLQRGNYWLSTNFYQQGGVLLGVSVGLLDQFSFGISYGGTNIIGSGKVEMNPLPGVNVRFRLIDEGQVMPAIALGFDSQGKEAYIDSTSRYTIKSPGFYAAASKNYEFLGNLSLHGGFNYSTERKDGDKDLNFYVGLEKSIGSIVSLLVEYDFATNDDNSRAAGQGNGYLNTGLRIAFGKGLHLGFDLKNITKNQDNITVGNRVLQLDFVSPI